MGNIVKLVFQAIATGSGFGKLLGDVKGLNEKMPGLSKAAQIVGMSFGTAGAAAGRMLSMLLQGSIWGVAAEGAKLLIDKLGLFRDKSAETKDKLDKLEESTRKFYQTINSNSQKSLEKIDAETTRRNAQLDITNRMIKAELQLQKAKAIRAGDVKRVERIDEQLAKADRTTAMDKAAGAERDAGSKVKTAEDRLAAAKKAEREANAALAKAEAALASASKPVETVMQSSAGAFFQTQTRDTTAEKAAVDAARKRLEIAEKATEAAQESVDAERERWRLAKEGVKALKAEQEAADAEAKAKARAKGHEDLKEMKKKADDELAAWKKAEAERIKKEEEDEKTYQANKKKAEIEALQKEVEKENEARKKALRDDIEANSKRASDLQQKLSDAIARANAAHDVLGNAAGMDQGGGVSAKRREWINNTRFANGSLDLMQRGKIRRGANGEWVANGRLSNMNQAILDRLNADENKRKLEKENDKVVRKLDELIKKLEQMSTL